MAIPLDYIRHHLCLEGESAHLDYKRDQYKFIGVSDPEKAELFKDILAMANAFRSQVAYILIGVDQQNGIGKVTGIPKDQFIDDASLQQFINGKTNRHIEFQSYSVLVDDEKIIQVIEIPVQKERPYYSEKQFGSIKPEVVFLRASSETHQADPDEIANMGKEEIIQSNRREIEITLDFPQNPVETDDVTAFDVVLDGDLPAGTVNNRNDVLEMWRTGSFFRKLKFVREVFHTLRIDIGLENKSALSAEQLEVETSVSQCSYRCVSIKKHFPARPDDPTPSALKHISSLQQRGLHPSQSEPVFESRYFEVNHDGDFTLDVTVLGKDMQPIRKSFPIHVQFKKYPLRAERIEQMFDSFVDEETTIQYMSLFGGIEK